MTDNFWIAEIETRHTSSRAFGSTPEHAVEALLELWRDDWASRSGADPDYLVEYRDDIEVSAFQLGGAYLKGGDDNSWHKEVIRGSDQRFDRILTSANPKPY